MNSIKILASLILLLMSCQLTAKDNNDTLQFPACGIYKLVDASFEDTGRKIPISENITVYILKATPLAAAYSMSTIRRSIPNIP